MTTRQKGKDLKAKENEIKSLKKEKSILEVKQEQAQKNAAVVQEKIIEKCRLLYDTPLDKDQAELIYTNILSSGLVREDDGTKALVAQNKEQIIKLIQGYAEYGERKKTGSALKPIPKPENSIGKQGLSQDKTLQKSQGTIREQEASSNIYTREWFQDTAKKCDNEQIELFKPDIDKLSKEKTRATKDEILQKLSEHVLKLEVEKKKEILERIANGEFKESKDSVVDYYLGLLRIHRNPLFNRSGIKMSNDTGSFSTLQGRARKILKENSSLTDDAMKELFAPRKLRWWERADKKKQSQSLSKKGFSVSDKESSTTKPESVSNLRGG